MKAHQLGIIVILIAGFIALSTFTAWWTVVEKSAPVPGAPPKSTPALPPGYADYRTRLIRVGQLDQYHILMNLEFTPDGTHIVAASQSGLYMFRTSDLSVASYTRTQAAYVAVHPSGTFVACAGLNFTVRLHAIPQGDLLDTLTIDAGAAPPPAEAPQGYRIDDLAFSPDGRHLAIIVYPFEEVFLYETKNWSLLRLLHTDRENCLATKLTFLENNLLAVREIREGPVITERGLTHVYDIGTGALAFRLQAPNYGITRVFGKTYEGRYLGDSTRIAQGGGSDIAEWGLDDPTQPAKFETPDSASPVAVSPDGRTFVFLRGNIALWDIENHSTYFLARLPTGKGRDAAISPDSQYAAVVQGWNMIFLFDIRKDAPPRPILTEPPVPNDRQGQSEGG